MGLTLYDAKKVAKIIETAEGGCGGCINEAVRELEKEFPDFKWAVKNIEGFNASIEVTQLVRPMPEPAFRPARRC